LSTIGDPISCPTGPADRNVSAPGVIGTETTVNATITAIDKKAKTATLKGENGKSVTVTPRDPKNLEKVKVGDRLVIPYTEAVAISVEKKAEKKK
jgi:hypothetical protein